MWNKPRWFLVTLLAFAAVARVQADDASYIAGIVAKLPADLWQRYQALNAAETRLPEYRDTDEALALKLAQLDHVNASRTRNGAGLVELDILASRVANRQAMEAAQNGFHGHWNLRGEKPYHRYAFAGGTDHVAENASWSSTTGVFTRTSELVSSMMVEAHGQFMAELAPNDGHKQNCIAREHTHVGLGFFLARSAFAYYEEFVDRYLEFIDPPFQAVAGNPVEIAVRPLKDGLYTYAVITYYEPFPKAMTVAEVNAHSSYPDFTNVQDSAIWPWELRTDGGGVTRIPLAFSRPGLYYVHIYLDTSKPSRGRADTRGKVQASGLVIRVQ